MGDIELARFVHFDQFFRDIRSFFKAGIANDAGVELVADLAGEITLERRTALLANEVELDGLAFSCPVAWPWHQPRERGWS